MMFHTLVELAISAAVDAQQELLRIEATEQNKAVLDAAYNALKQTIETLSLLVKTEIE